jgi:Fic family protein
VFLFHSQLAKLEIELVFTVTDLCLLLTKVACLKINTSKTIMQLHLTRLNFIFASIKDTNKHCNQIIMAKKEIYIHNVHDWPNFIYDDSIVLPVLSAVRLKQGFLLGKMQNIGFDLQNQAVLNTITLDILKNSEIEGEILNQSEVRSSVANKLGIELKSKEHVGHYVKGMVKMMLDATQNFSDTLKPEKLFGWHAALFPTGYSGKDKINVAKYRKHEMVVKSGALGKEKVHIRAPKPEEVITEMKKFIIWFNSSGEDSIIKAAIAHLWFETIHPFDDGNGRIGRALTDMLLARSDMNKQRFYSMSSAILTKRKRYYKVLESTQKGTMNVTNWVVWFIETLNTAISDSEEKLKVVFQKAAFWDKFRNTKLNDRQKLIINKVLDGHEGLVRTDKWATIANCPKITASRDISDLVKKEILKPNGKGGRSTAYDIIL